MKNAGYRIVIPDLCNEILSESFEYVRFKVAYGAFLPDLII